MPERKPVVYKDDWLKQIINVRNNLELHYCMCFVYLVGFDFKQGRSCVFDGTGSAFVPLPMQRRIGTENPDCLVSNIDLLIETVTTKACIESGSF